MKAGSEAAFQRQVEQLARYYDWLVFHAPDNRPGRNGRVQRVTPGFPDLVLVRPPELIFAELKAQKGAVRPEQRTWIAALDRVADHADHVEVHLWRPADFDVLHKRLARGRHRSEPIYRPEAA